MREILSLPPFLGKRHYLYLPKLIAIQAHRELSPNRVQIEKDLLHPASMGCQFVISVTDTEECTGNINAT